MLLFGTVFASIQPVLPSWSPTHCSTHVGARHPVVAITLRKLAELELAAADAEEAAAAAASDSSAAGAAAAGSASSGSKAGSKAGSKGSQPAAQLTLKERERRQAVAIAEEALSIAQQAYGESLEWQRKQGQPESGGLLGWLRPKPTLAALRRPQRPDSAALEVGHCLLTLSHAHAAVKQPAAAATDLEGGLKLLDDAFPNAAAARAARVDEPEEQRADQQEVSVPPSRRAAGGNGSGSSSNAASSSEEEEGSSGSAEADVNVQAAANLAKAVSAKEAARAQRVEQARKQLACSMLAELLVLAGGGEADLAAVQERWAQEGCAAS